MITKLAAVSKEVKTVKTWRPFSRYQRKVEKRRANRRYRHTLNYITRKIQYDVEMFYDETFDTKTFEVDIYW